MTRARSLWFLCALSLCAFGAACKSPAPIVVADAGAAPVPVVASGIVAHEEVGDAAPLEDAATHARFFEGFVGSGKIQTLGDADAHAISDSLVPGAVFVLPVFLGDFGPSPRTLFAITQKESLATYGVMALADHGDHWEKISIAPIVDFSSWRGWQVDAVLFEDVDRNGARAPIIIADYMTGIGPTGAEPFTVVTVYRFKGGAFVHATDIEKILSGATDARAVRARLSGQLPKRNHP